MERLMKELLMERQKLDKLKAYVNNMEYDALQRRFRRVNSTSLIPTVRSCTPLQNFRIFLIPLEPSIFGPYLLKQGQNCELRSCCLSVLCLI